jgi:mRNA interferase MazF
VVVVAGQGEFGKPRPGIVLQKYSVEGFPTVTFVPVTSVLYGLPRVRIPIAPDEANGLRQPSEVMIDRVQTVGWKRVGQVIGRVDEDTMQSINTALLVFLGLV